MLQIALVGAGGFVGAILRYTISDWMRRAAPGPFPLGTLTVNLIGCLLLGSLMAAVQQKQLGAQAQLFWTTGIVGALTTFSTFGYETLELLRLGQWRLALMSTAANVVVGVMAVSAGYRVGGGR